MNLAPTSGAKDGRRVYPNLLIWAPFLEGRQVPVFLDQNVKVIEPFTLYAMECAKAPVDAQLPMPVLVRDKPFCPKQDR